MTDVCKNNPGHRVVDNKLLQRTVVRYHFFLAQKMRAASNAAELRR